MKRLFKIALLSLALAASGACDDKNDEQPRLKANANNIAGTWCLAEFGGAEPAEGTYVYIEFIRKDALFEMYQNIDSFLPRKLTGRFGIAEEETGEEVIRGLYDHGVGDWKHSYRITEFTAERMVWTALDDADDVSVYVRCDEIPEEIR